jgi:23S rRNA 5-hydroxycytidine C2501 synthase
MPTLPLELLSPAKDLACGIAAIDHGADAVYIGGPSFSARAAAGNSLADIERLVSYAHQYAARVYIALNTLLSDAELEEAAAIAHAVWNVGADALIIQDMGLLECDLPPIPLHASTQMDNRSREKVRFLEKVGFRQVVLARELSLQQIREIRRGTTVALECFVHGALCVSYSGQCYMSEMITGRSANRGECSQFCRHLWSLKDAGGHVLDRGRYFLSLKDLDLSARIADLAAAGVSSFKIEGRLKDERYVKNVTAAYRLILDELLEAKTDLRRTSSGRCTFDFRPDTSRSFNRGKTEYFFMDPRNRPASINTPKAIGQELGIVDEVDRQSFTLVTEEIVANGDGLCFFDAHDQLVGLKANRVEGRRIFPKDPVSLTPGTRVYRNFDSSFARQLDRSAGCRRIPLDIWVEETPSGLRLRLEDGDGYATILEQPLEKTRARTSGKTEAVIQRQMAKSGGTIFSVGQVQVAIDPKIHITAADLNDMRRMAFERHVQTRLDRYSRTEAPRIANTVPWPAEEVTYLDNIANLKARAFYARHGVKNFYLAPGGLQDEEIVVLMACKYCLKRQLQICPKENRHTAKLLEPLTLSDNTGSYGLQFDCGRCEMRVVHLKKHSA